MSSRDALAGALRERLPQLRFVLPSGGLSLWIELPDPIAAEVTLAAEDEGLLIASGPRFAAAGGLDRWIRLPYVLTPDELVEAAARLERALGRVATGTPRSTVEGARAPHGPLVA